MHHLIEHLYIHIPFCKSECSYCAFYKERFTPRIVDQWLKATAQEIQWIAARYDLLPKTIYIGGGSPSVLSIDQFNTLAQVITHAFDMRNCKEWTIEANPESIDAGKVRAWVDAGINRISIGAQSFEPEILKHMHRTHTPEMVEEAIARVRTHPDIALGLDIIAGFPGATEQSWLETLSRLVAIRPEHISVYECTMHPGTRLHREIENKSTKELSHTQRNRALRMAERFLEENGYEHYETSNFCLKGKRCLHNTAVWLGKDYVGIGPGASSRVGDMRWTNRPDLANYLKHTPDINAPREEDRLSPEQDATERLMFAFRLRDPVSLDDFSPHDAELARQLAQHWRTRLAELRQAKLVCHSNGYWRTSAKGRTVVDAIAEALLP
jgi:oxygen-independent coproporphyrinogen III oxidase